MSETKTEFCLDAAESFMRALEKDRRDRGEPVGGLKREAWEAGQKLEGLDEELPIDKLPAKGKAIGLGAVLAAAGLVTYRISRKRVA